MKPLWTASIVRLFLSIVSVLLATHPCMGQSEVIAPPSSLVVEEIPKIPASLAETARRYTEFRSASLMNWHPVRREILIGTRFADTVQLHHVKFPGGDRQQLTFFPDRINSGSYQTSNGDSFVFSKGSGGNERNQLYRYDVATGNITLLTDGKSKNLSPIWSKAGDRLVYSSTRRTGKDWDIYVINPLDPQSDRIVAQLEGGINVPLDWSPDDRHVLIFQHSYRDESLLWIVDITSGEKTLLNPKQDAESNNHNSGQFSKDGKGLYVTTDRGSEFQRLAYVDLATKQYTFLTDDIKADVDELSLSDDGKTLAFLTNEDGISRLHLLDTSTRRGKRVPDLPVAVITKLQWHKNNRDLGFVMQSARYPADVYSLDVQTSKVERWTYSETGGLNTNNFSEAKLIRWTSFDGRVITGFSYAPPAKFKGPRPVIVNIHGGPEVQFRPIFGGSDNYFVNELGIAIIYPNVRGSSGYGKTFLSLDNSYLRENAWKDIGTLIDYIKTQPDLDAERIMVTGVSYGGFMALAVATNYNDRIRAALSYVGPSNLVTLIENTESNRREVIRTEFGDERDSKMREFLERTAPLNNLSKVTKPLFIVHGANDPRVPLSEAKQLVTAVKKRGTPYYYLLAQDEGHGYVKKTNRDFMFYSTILFVKEHLLQ